MAKYLIEDTTLAAIAEAVRAAAGSTGAIKISEIATNIIALKPETVVLEETTVEIVSAFGTLITPADLPAMDNFVIGQTYNIIVSIDDGAGTVFCENEQISVVAESETQLQFASPQSDVHAYEGGWTYTITCGSGGSTITHNGDENRAVTIKITTP